MTPLFLRANNPGPMTGDGNWTYVIAGAQPVLIDAGVGEASHLAAIAAAAPDGPARVVVTHAHSDHISGALSIHQRWPTASLAKHPWPDRDPPLPWQRLDDGSVVPTDEGELVVLHTPGHSPDHLTLWHADSRTLFTGDMLVLGSTVVIPASHGGSLSDYLKSLARLLALGPARALPAHGPVIEDPSALITHYLQHRAQREQQVLEVLRISTSTLESITEAIYPVVRSELLGMARESVLAHLIKLESEGRVTRDDARWAVAP
jgi:glyoxylase-like metal-dependent hydrolase (beta-lactamase superfamily II)